MRRRLAIRAATTAVVLLSALAGRQAVGQTDDGNSAERAAIESRLKEYFPATDPNFVARRDLDGVMRQLILLNQAQAMLPTVYDHTGPYFKIKQVFLAKADDEKLKKMLESDRAVVRVMAMDCLLQRHNTDAFKYLRPRLGSRAILRNRVGCVGIAPTEGSFVRYLMMSYIEEPRVTVDGEKSTYLIPRLTAEQRNGLILEILSRNDTAVMHKDLVSYLYRWRDVSSGRDTGSGKGIFDEAPAQRELAFPLDLPELRKLPGGLGDAGLIKAIGRIRSIIVPGPGLFEEDPLPQVESFLIQCLGDEKLDAQARLAAGSALTCWADPNTAKALESAKDTLKKLQPGAGTKIWQTLKIRRQYEKDLAILRQQRAWGGGVFDPPPETPDPNDVTRAIISAADKYDHPMIWQDFGWYAAPPQLSGAGLGEDKATPSSLAVARMLLKASAQMAERVEPWNTYGHVPCLAQHDLNWDEYWQTECKRRPELIPPDLSELKQLLSEKDYDRFRRNVRAAVAAEERAAGRKKDATSKREKTQKSRK